MPHPIVMTADFDYDLPADLIAQEPTSNRDRSRLLVVDRSHGACEDAVFADLPDYLVEGDVLLANQSRVIPARLHGRLDSGGVVELLLVRRLDDSAWEVMARPARKLRLATRLQFTGEMSAVVQAVRPEGRRIVQFEAAEGLDSWLQMHGEMPIPPYIKRQPVDPERYQTVYGRVEGSIAAPTAGLHFTPELLDRLRRRGVDIRFVTLHVGPGTFKTLVDNAETVQIEPEFGSISASTATSVMQAKDEGRRIVAVGTTTTRLLESVYRTEGRVTEWDGPVDLFIRPPFTFNVVDALVTNFHLPRSSLLMLVTAFAGRDMIRQAYDHAIAARYRFYSFGDATFIY